MFGINKFSFLLIVTVQAVMLPGSCPNVPVTNEFCENMQSYQEVLFGIPFSPEHPSHLFKEINRTNVVNFDCFINTKAGFLELANTESRSTFRARTHPVIIEQTAWIITTLNSTIYQSVKTLDGYTLEPSKCHSSIKEEVKIWCWDDFLIIWSCTNHTIGKHDEAVMVIVKSDPKDITSFYNDRRHSIDSYNAMMERLNYTVSSMLNETQIFRLDQIEWVKQSSGSTVPKKSQSPEEFWPCDIAEVADAVDVPDEAWNWNLVLISVAVSLLVFIIGFLLWYGSRDNFNTE